MKIPAVVRKHGATAFGLFLLVAAVYVVQREFRDLKVSDVLTALGVDIEADFGLVERAIREARIGFMMAPRHHGAMRHVAGPRVELGTRTVFNLRNALPPNGDELARDYPLTAQGFAEWDRRWRQAYAKSFRGLVVDGYRLEKVRNLLPVAVRGLHREPQMSTWTDVDQALEGLIEAVSEYLGRAPV